MFTRTFFTRIARPAQSLAAAVIVGAAVMAATIVAASVTTSAVVAPAHADALPLGAHKAFVLIEYQVRDKDLFAKLRDQVRESLKASGGDLVMREKVSPIFGGSPTNLSVIGFASIDDARKWLASKEMAAFAAQRDKAANLSTYLVEKLD